MRIAVFDTHRYDQTFLEEANARHHHELAFLEPRLTRQTAPLANGFDMACSFVNCPSCASRSTRRTPSPSTPSHSCSRSTARSTAPTSACARATFGCHVVAHDIAIDDELVSLGIEYVSREVLYARADIISLHVQLGDATRHMIDPRALAHLSTA